MYDTILTCVVDLFLGGASDLLLELELEMGQARLGQDGTGKRKCSCVVTVHTAFGVL